ncbi:MAG: tRNA-dihydrouridine synthase family protein [Anaerolineaceae bacterium]|nr:tRNA-dihydrouridine synthase family protein [Anaerolineaceae bacterium]MDI9530487.1 tRNA-dihydrouridine synthase family protein [Chloroflexota bacterium]NLE92388.1 tRNA-dihydrouridine synthase family protein [Chloroflexota bacterium]HNZ16438.1 tRNA-dihydrouridine synthase family protein [Anaerolineaceae bacterium]HOF29053.1 tRNA-dihydrouridine synthase family protein [Anaerolineaceae bacterium]
MAQADFTIGDIPIHGRLILAPMDGISDAAFRLLTRRLGSAYSVSEFINTLDYANQKNYQKKRLLARQEERPFAAQLLDNDAVRMAECAARIEEEFHPDIIDINMGCAAKSVAGRGAGVGMMRDPQLVRDAVAAVSRAVKVPVTVKMRLGWDSASLNFLEIASLAAENGAKALALHGRTGKISFHKPAQWQPIAELKRAFEKLPVIGNGDVCTPADARRMLEQTGCDAVMIGRAAKANPWIFSWRSREEVPIQEVAETAIWQLGDMLASDPENAVLPFRKYLKAYLEPSHLPRETMRTLLTCPDPTRLLALMNEIFRELGATLP